MIYLWASIAVFVVCIGVFFYMKWRMRASKAKFALATVSAIVSCLILGITSSSSGFVSSLTSSILVRFGFEPLQSGTTNLMAMLLTGLAMLLIYRFGTRTIEKWDAPPRVSEIELADNYLQNSIYALSLEQIRLILKRQVDPIASDAASNWQVKLSEPPHPIETKDLLKDLLTTCIREIQIPEDGWRDGEQLWLGQILGLQRNEAADLIAFVFDGSPSSLDLKERLLDLEKKRVDLNDVKLYAIYPSSNEAEDQSRLENIGGLEIQVLSSRKMIFMGLDLPGYARELLKSFRNTSVGGTNATLENSFVELLVDRPKSGWPPIPLSRKITTWEKETTNCHLALTGEYGQGKSTALLKYCCDWAESFLEDGEIKGRIPLLIELRGKSPSEVDPLVFLSTWCSRYHLLPQQVFNLIKSGDAVVIFEGFDELKNAGRAFDRHQHFNALWRFAYPGTKLIFTGRPNFFLDQTEANRTLRNETSRVVAGGPYTEVWQLQKMNNAQISQACRSYEDIVSEGIVRSVDENEDFLEIVSRPSMLPVVATIWGEIEELKKAGTHLTGAVLIEKYIQAVFARKEAELERDRIQRDAPSGSRYLVLPRPARELLTVCVAWRMSGLGGQNTISRLEISDMVKDVYDTLFAVSKSDTTSPEVQSGMIEFEKRFSDESLSERVEIITSEICSSGLLIPDPAGGTTNLRYPHKQFFEFLVAKGVLIYKSERTMGSSALIGASSSDKSVFMRLQAEPNAIQYLAECNGPSVAFLYSNLDRTLSRLVLYQAVLIMGARSLLRKLIRKLRAGGKKDIDLLDLDGPAEEPKPHDRTIWASRNVRRNVMMMMASVSSSMMLVMGLTVFSTVSGFAGSASISSSTISLMLLLLMSSLLGISMSSILNLSRLDVLMRYLWVHWRSADQNPRDQRQSLKLAARTLIKGEVAFPDQVAVIIPDTAQFLYPADHFDSDR